jgi:hypothetical protein
MKKKEVHIIILEADEGKEIYNISNPDIYGKTITLGKNDSPENWAERPETIIEDTVDLEVSELPNPNL